MEKIMAKDELKMARVRRGLTKAEVARRVGISKQGYGNIERNTHGVAPSTATRICSVLGAEWTDLFEFSKVEDATK